MGGNSYSVVLCTEEEAFVPSKMQLEQCLDILSKHGMLHLAEQQNYNSLEEIMGKKWKDFDWDHFYSEHSPNSAYFIVYAQKSFFQPFYDRILKELDYKTNDGYYYIDTVSFINEYTIVISQNTIEGPMGMSFNSKFVICNLNIGNGHLQYPEAQKISHVFREIYLEIIRELEHVLGQDLKIIMDWAD